MYTKFGSVRFVSVDWVVQVVDVQSPSNLQKKYTNYGKVSG